MSGKKKLLFTIILITLGLVLFELFAFIFLSIVGYERTKGIFLFHPLRHHAQRPNSVIDQGYSIPLKTNRFGFLRISPEIKNPDFTLVLTGSSSLRSQRPFTGHRGTIPSRLQKLFQENYSEKIKVISLAVGSYSAFNEMASIYDYLEKHRRKADMIVSVNGLFSIFDLSNRHPMFVNKGDIHDLYDQKATDRINQIKDGEIRAIFAALNQSIRSSQLNSIKLIFYLKSKFKKVKTESKANNSTKGLDWAAVKNNPEFNRLYQQLRRREKMNYDIINQIARNYQVPYMLFLMPAEYTWKNLSSKKMTEKYKFQLEYNSKLYTHLTHGVTYPVIDLSDAFDELPADSSPYPEGDPVHYNDEGAEIIAKALYKSINPVIKDRLGRQ